MSRSDVVCQPLRILFPACRDLSESPPVPIPAHDRAVFSGTFGETAGPLETWSFRLNGTGLTDALLGQNERDLIASAMKDAWVAALMPGQFGFYVHLTSVKTSEVGEDGLVSTNSVSGAYNQGEWTGDVPGNVGAAVLHTFQTAIVCSLNTTRSGPTGKGRVFLPSPAQSLEADGRISVDRATMWADKMATFLGMLKNDVGFTPVVASSKGYLTPVISVRVGRALDTMRSRRSDLAEGYVTAMLPAA